MNAQAILEELTSLSFRAVNWTLDRIVTNVNNFWINSNIDDNNTHSRIPTFYIYIKDKSIAKFLAK